MYFTRIPQVDRFAVALKIDRFAVALRTGRFANAWNAGRPAVGTSISLQSIGALGELAVNLNASAVCRK
jgi:hypothetical protein